ncbi:MAG TPA: tRNA uridine-5-carboxymethylaminomethyl(34) synthesis GTPase MnmE [Candidatus Alistipes excrementipullorum]|nr:tRNA uridine-5-carboxymethylaminomethyl(34) synthesis GTPase MnmE [Candidatus Alistipes excrementipullorum]
MVDNDIIVAPATAMGGAIAVIRMSGEGAVECCDKVFAGRSRLADAAPYTVHYGRIVDGDRTLDDVLVSVFRAPHSYTGEDSVEISIHGSKYIASEVMSLLVRNGARMARAGEFSVRAFLAGKMDLSQAEAVADMIAADSRASHALASTQMRGGYSRSLQSLRRQLLDIASLLELELDFSEEEVEFADRSHLENLLNHTGAEIGRLMESFATGNAIKEGVATAIVGAPNVGKSTLLNRLVGEDRAMISDIAGTTRDTVEAHCNIDGVQFRFVDTAGIRTTDDRLEQMGIERTMKALREARIVIQMIEAGCSGFEPVAVGDGQTLIVVANKADRSDDRSVNDAIYISAKSGDGVDELRARLRSTVDTERIYAGETVVSNARHFAALQRASEALTRAMTALHSGLSGELLSEEIREVLQHIGEITGDVTSDDILKNIFSKFCIGK